VRRGTTVCRSRLGKHATEILPQIQPEEPRVQMAYTLYRDRRLTVADIWVVTQFEIYLGSHAWVGAIRQ
jgi:hypothetical protein